MLALVFPGQGSQYLGMGKSFYDIYPQVREIFNFAEKVSGIPVRSLCFEGPAEELMATENLQVCITVINLSCYEVLKNHLGENISEIKLVSGHSLGEFSALYASSVLTLEETLMAVKERGRIMGSFSSDKPSGMYAMINLPLEHLEKLTKEAKGLVVISNYNSPNQYVISGEEPYLTEVAERAKAAGAKVVKLKVSAGFHSPLMKAAQKRFSEYLKRLQWKEPSIPFVSTVSGKIETSARDIAELMCRQIVSSVRWIDAVNHMYEQGVRVFVELGPKKVLCGLISQILKDKEHKVFNIEDEGSLHAFLKETQNLF